MKHPRGLWLFGFLGLGFLILGLWIYLQEAKLLPSNSTPAQVEQEPLLERSQETEIEIGKAEITPEIQSLQQQHHELSRCLREETCGKSPASLRADKPYFEPNKSSENVKLNDLLKQLKYKINENPELIRAVSEKDLLLNLEIPNRETQILSAELFLEKNDSLTGYKTLLKNSPLITESARSIFLGLVAPEAQEPEKQILFLEVFESYLKSNDMASVLKILENLSEYPISLSEAQKIAPSICRIKNDERLSQNWEEASASIKAWLEAHGEWQLSVEGYCR